MVDLLSICFVLGLLILLVIVSMGSLEDLGLRKEIKVGMLNQKPVAQISWKIKLAHYLNLTTYPDFLNRFIDQKTVIWSGIMLSKQQYLQLIWLLFLAGILLEAILLLMGLDSFSWILNGILLIFCLTFGPKIYLKYRITKRRRAIEHALPYFLDMLMLTVEAGFGLVPAIKRIKDGYKGEFGQMIHELLIQLELGFSKSQALGYFAAQVPSLDVLHLTESILLSERLGTSLSRTIRIQSNLLRTRRRQLAEARAKTVPIRIIPALVFFFLPGLLLIYLAPPIIILLLQRS